MPRRNTVDHTAVSARRERTRQGAEDGASARTADVRSSGAAEASNTDCRDSTIDSSRGKGCSVETNRSTGLAGRREHVIQYASSVVQWQC